MRQHDGVWLFVITPEFRRRQQPPRPRDEMPIKPMVDVLLLWVFMTLGGFCGSVGLMAMIGAEFEDMPLDHPTRVLIVAMTLAAPLFFFGTWTMWRRLNRSPRVPDRLRDVRPPEM